VGADFTHEMLVLANKKGAKLQASARANGIPFVFLQADAQRLPFADEQFQIVCVAFGLRNVTDTRLGLREMVRVCQTGGKVVVLEFSLPANRLMRGLYTWYFRNILPRIGQLVSGSRQQAYNYLPESVGAFPYGERLAAVMQECGLARVAFTPLTFGIATLYIGEK
jgi:demethylmenaquinone methyltransferase/2-methoxy-6-polyprenyl-1,4-benzoquinol methylase